MARSATFNRFKRRTSLVHSVFARATITPIGPRCSTKFAIGNTSHGSAGTSIPSSTFTAWTKPPGPCMKAPPIAAFGIGGRQCRGAMQGDIYDHHAVVYEYPNGVTVHSYCRQMDGCYPDISDIIVGTQGRALLPFLLEIKGANPWRYKKPEPSEHVRHRASRVVRRHPLGQYDQ